MSPGKSSRRALVGDTVNEGDTLVTGDKGELHLTMADSGFIALRPNTRMQIATYKADGGADDHGVFNLVSGGMRSITGWIGKFNQKSYQVRTPTATVGIRGTDHETRYLPPGSAEGPPGTYDKVFYGETTIVTGAGEAEVSPEKAGFSSSDPGQQPEVLAKVPTFFKPGPHEDLINAKHAEIQKIIEQRRDERRKIVEQLRVAFLDAAAQLKAQGDSNKAADAQRQAQADAQRQAFDERRAALHAREDALQGARQTIADLRMEIAREVAPDIARNRELAAQLKALRDKSQEIRQGYDDLKAARKAMADANLAAAEARQASTDSHRKLADERLETLKAKLAELQQHQLALQAMRQAIKDGYAKYPEGNAELTAQRRAADQVADNVAKEQSDYQSGINALFEDNIAFAEANIEAAKAQRINTEQQVADFNAKDEELAQEQSAIDTSRENLQEKSVIDPAKKAHVHDLILKVRAAVQALREERKNILAGWKALSAEDSRGAAQRQNANADELKKIREKHQQVNEKLADLQSETASMQQEIRSLYEAEQKRYLEELRAARQQQTSPDATADPN